MDKKAAETPVAVHLKSLIELARQGRKEVLPLLRQAFEQRPSLWQNHGNIAYQAQNHWLAMIAETDLFFRESMGWHSAQLRADLAGSDATPLECLQIERIVALNLQLGYYECLIPKYEGAGNSRVLDYLNERAGVADRKLQQAIVGLARIRKLLPRVLKVDVVVSGEVQTTVNATETKAETGKSVTRVQVPQNRIKDLLAAAVN